MKKERRINISHPPPAILHQVLARMNYLAMNFTNHSNTTGTSEKYLIIIPNPDLDIVQGAFFTTLSLLLVITALASNTFLIASLAKKSPVPYCNHLIIILCATDMGKSCLHFMVYTVSTPMDSWFLGSIMCKVLPSLLDGCELYSLTILNMTARSRYKAVCKPLDQVKQKKWWIYVELLLNTTACFGYELWTKFERSNQYYIEGETRCVDDLLLQKKTKLISIVNITYFSYVTLGFYQQTYYFIRIACTLRKNSKHLADNRLESSQRLKRNKKAVKTIFIMVAVYDVVVLPSAALKIIALYFTAFTAFRELSQILVLLYCSFNSVFYIWRDERLKTSATRFLAKLFCRK